jgi:hypothetical protein
MSRFAPIAIVVGATLCAVTGCSGRPASAAAGSGGHWTDNGATACSTYLTQDVVSTILSNPAGGSKKLSVQSCTYNTTDSGGSITITLTNAGLPAFDKYQQYLVDPVPLAGVGDKASQSLIGIDAVKGADRGCDIDAGGAPGSLKVHGAELGQKLGAICNQLFALP